MSWSVAPASCPEDVSRPQLSKREPKTESEGLAVGSGRPRGLEFVEQSIKEKEVAQKKL